MTFYSREHIDLLSRQKKRSISAVIVISIALICLYVCSIFLINDTTKIWITVLLIVITFFCLATILYVAINLIVYKRDIIRHIAIVLTSEEKEISGKVVDIKDKTTISHNIDVFTISVNNNNETYTLYYCDLMGDMTFKKDDNISFTTGSNFIVEVKKL